MKAKALKFFAIFMAVSLLIPALPWQSEANAATPDIYVPSGYELVVELFNIDTDSNSTKGTGEATSDYELAVNLNQPSGHFQTNYLTEGAEIVVLYDSIEVPQMFIQNYNADPEIEGSIQASRDDHNNGVAYFVYEDIYDFYMTEGNHQYDFSEITNIAIQSKTEPLTVHRVYVIKEIVASENTDIVIPTGYNFLIDLYNIDLDSQTTKGTGVSTGDYDFVVNLNQPSGHFDASYLVQGTKVAVLYESVDVPQLYIQNYNSTPEISGAIQASSSDPANDVAYFDFEDIEDFYDDAGGGDVDFDDITNLVVQSKMNPLTVFKVYIIEDENNSTIPNLIVPTGHKFVTQLFNINLDSATTKGTGVSTGDYDFVVNLNQPSGHFDSSYLVEGTKVAVLYDSVDVPQLYIQNYNSTPEISGAIQASSSDPANGVAYFDYEDIFDFYDDEGGGDVEFDDITNLVVQSKETPLTAYRVYIIAELTN